MKITTEHWEKPRAEDPLTLMRRGELKKLCAERNITFDQNMATARELRILLRKSGYGNEDASQQR